MQSVKVGSKKFEKIVQRGDLGKRRLQKKVANIIEKVRVAGDAALISYTKKFDKVAIMRKDLCVTEAEISGAYQDIKPEIVNTLKEII